MASPRLSQSRTAGWSPRPYAIWEHRWWTSSRCRRKAASALRRNAPGALVPTEGIASGHRHYRTSFTTPAYFGPPDCRTLPSEIAVSCHSKQVRASDLALGLPSEGCRCCGACPQPCERDLATYRAQAVATDGPVPLRLDGPSRLLAELPGADINEGHPFGHPQPHRRPSWSHAASHVRRRSDRLSGWPLPPIARLTQKVPLATRMGMERVGSRRAGS